MSPIVSALLSMLPSCTADKPDAPTPDSGSSAAAVHTGGDGAAGDDSAARGGTEGDTAGDSDSDSGSDGPWTTGSPLAFSRRPRNLLVITLDTTRRDYLGRYSGDPEATPTLDALMKQGLTLDDHRSCSDWTWESVLCAQTGRLPWRLGLRWSGETGGAEPYPEHGPLISHALYDQGFQTSLVSAQSYIGGGLGLERGFQRIAFQSDMPAAELVEHAGQALAELDPARPWYLHLHFLDPHHLYRPPPEYLAALEELDPLPYDLGTDEGYLELLNNWGPMGPEQRELATAHLQARYRGELRYLDDQLARLWGLLDEGGWLEGTLALIWTDHGEQLYQHGAPNHGGGLYDEESRAAAVFWSRDLLSPSAYAGPTTHQDLWPTLLDALGIDDTLGMEGRLVGARPAEEPRHALHYRGPETDQAVVLGDNKLLYDWEGRAAFFRLDEDPGETVDRYDPEDPEVIALWELLAAEAGAITAVTGTAPVSGAR